MNNHADTSAQRAWLPKAAILSLMCMFTVGCQQWPSANRIAQSQIESERLLTEYRAQKKRADDLESRNRQLSDRLSESEKMLARLQGSDSNSNRLASQPGSYGKTYQDRSLEQYSSDFRSQTAGRITPADARSAEKVTPASNSDQLKWRPRH